MGALMKYRLSTFVKNNYVPYCKYSMLLSPTVDRVMGSFLGHCKSGLLIFTAGKQQ